VGARFSAPVQTSPGAHPASCTMGTGSFPGVKSGRSVMLTPHPLLVPWSLKGRAIPLLSQWAVRPVQSLSACTRVTFTFLQFKSVKVHPITCHRRHREGAEVWFYSFLASAKDRSGWSMHNPATLPPRKSPDNHCTGGSIPLQTSPRAGLEGYGEAKLFCLPPGFKTWTVQPVVSRYTNYAMPAV